MLLIEESSFARDWNRHCQLLHFHPLQSWNSMKLSRNVRINKYFSPFSWWNYVFVSVDWAILKNRSSNKGILLSGKSLYSNMWGNEMKWIIIFNKLNVTMCGSELKRIINETVWFLLSVLLCSVGMVTGRWMEIINSCARMFGNFGCHTHMKFIHFSRFAFHFH